MSELRLKSTGTIKLFENDNTSNITIASPASLGADRTIPLPDASVTLASGTMNDATNLSGTVPIANGGTASTSTTYCDLTANVTGILPAANGGVQAFSGARVTNSATQAVGTSSDDILDWDGEQFDTDGYHDNSTNNSRMTIPSLSGSAAISYVLISANVYWTLLQDAEVFELRIFQNGASTNAYSRQISGGNASRDGAIPVGGSSVFSCTAGDYFEVCVSTDGAGTVIAASDLGSADGYFASYNIMRIG